jgi:hypothetical protein
MLPASPGPLCRDSALHAPGQRNSRVYHRNPVATSHRLGGEPGHALIAERDRIYAEQARRYPGFAGYERQTAGVRTIPVLELSRA